MMPARYARLLLVLALPALLVLTLSPSARGHGGSYRGPTVPPPDTGPVPAPPPGTKMPRGGVTPRRRPAATPALDVRLWETWWGFNKEEFLPIRGVIGQTGNMDGYGDRRAPTPEEIRAQVLPALTKLLAKSRDKDIRNSAALAIGRIGDVREYRLLESYLDDKERTVIEAAILGLGLLRSPRAEKRLIDLARNATRSARERGFAMMALGYSGGDMAKAALFESLGIPRPGGFSHRGRAAQLETLRALAAGLASRSDLVAKGADVEPDPATPHLVKGIRAGLVKERTFLPIALSALGKTRDPAATKTVFSGLGHRKADVRAGAALAVGRVLRDANKKIFRRLAITLRSEGDLFPRRMLLISLGRIGGDDARNILRAESSHRDRQHVAFAALALAIADDGGAIPRFRGALETARDASMKGAYAIALGILQDKDSIPIILKLLEKDRNPDVRAHLVEALTIMRATTAVPVIEKLLIKTKSPNLQAACAQALGLMAPFASAQTMITLLRSRRVTTVAQGALATGLGRMGDHRLVEPLLGFAKADANQDVARAFAITALGILGEKNPSLPPFSRVAIDSHYELRIPVLDELRHLF
ncbi:MAG: hypothetical protein CMJ83_19875 [Planctomycetes bacterium]|nr:hypothetical protein [Planctomycetota bacterium]